MFRKRYVAVVEVLSVVWLDAASECTWPAYVVQKNEAKFSS